MTHAIKHLFHINAKRSDVFKAISSIEGLQHWWTAATTGDPAKDGIMQFRFGDAGPDMKVTNLQPGEAIGWECVASPHGWVGHRFTIHLDDNEGKTRVRFVHTGWEAPDDFYAICSFAWGRYLESLRQYCQTGKGEAFGTESYRR